MIGQHGNIHFILEKKKERSKKGMRKDVQGAFANKNYF